MRRSLAQNRSMAVIRECVLALLVIALAWRVGLPMGTMLSMDGQGQLIEVCTLTGLEIAPVAPDVPDQPSKLMDQCPLVMAGTLNAPPPVFTVTPPAKIGAVETVQFTQIVHDNAPFQAPPPRGPPAVQA
jgi:hypothetical protein